MQEPAHLVTGGGKGSNSQFVRIGTGSEFTSSEVSEIAFDSWQP